MDLEIKQIDVIYYNKFYLDILIFDFELKGKN